jgi:hypothetical protein
MVFDGAKRDSKAILKLNNARADRMEIDVMKQLNGHRVPMSGAGDIKGDGLGYCDFGPYIVECKYTSQMYHNTERLWLNTMWLTKLEGEVRYMHVSFGFLVVRYHTQRKYYVFIRKDWFKKISQELISLDDAVVLDCKKQKRPPISRAVLDAALLVYPYAVVETQVGEYVVMDMELMKGFLGKKTALWVDDNTDGTDINDANAQI